MYYFPQEVKKILLLLLLFLSVAVTSVAQEKKSSFSIDSTKVNKSKNFKFNYKQLIIPAVTVGYGVLGLESDQLLIINAGIKEEVKEHIDEKLTVDDFLQYAPLAAALSLDLVGVKGKNNFKNKAIIATTSYLIMGITVNSLKKITRIERPDGSGFNSFPSGHTATAFLGAELLYQEYKDKSIWYGISGYIVATGTGAFRIYNNRHWLTDVFAGAGIGILSTKAAYWLYPIVSKLFTNNKDSNYKTAFVPYYDGKTAGFGLVSKF